MKPAKTQPTPEEQCCPMCGSANFWVESPTEGIAAKRIENATVHNQDRLTCHQCHYGCAGVVFSATLAKRRKATTPVPIDTLVAPEVEVYINGEFVGTSANVDVQVERIMPGTPPDLSQDCPAHQEHLKERLRADNTPFDYRDFITMPAALSYGSTPAPKPVFRHGKKHNHRCTKTTQKKARRRARA